jgi:hypothetical protein
MPTWAKYPLQITANGIILSNDVVAAGADFCVGQSIQFDVTGLPSRVYDLTTVWTLPGTFVNTNSNPNCDLFYEENAALLRPPQGTSAMHCWYVKDGLPLTASVRVLYRLAPNGQFFDETITGKFNVHRPATAKATPYQPDGTPTPMVVGDFLTLGNGRDRDMSFQHTITTDTYCAGQAGYVQVLDGDYTDPKNVNCVEVPINGPALDGALDEFPADRQTPVPANASSSLLRSFYDGPHVAMWNGCAQEDLSFSTYLMFNPGGAGSIWVPLRLITWELHDEAANGALVNGAEHVIGPVDNETTDFPKWTKKY